MSYQHPTKKAIFILGDDKKLVQTALKAMGAYIQKHSDIQAVEEHVYTRLPEAVHKLFGLSYGPAALVGSMDKPDSGLLQMTPASTYDKLQGAVRDLWGADIFGRMCVQFMRRRPYAQVHVFTELVNGFDIEPIQEYIGFNSCSYIVLNKPEHILTGEPDCANMVHIEHTPSDDLFQKELFRVYIQGATKRFLNIKDGTET